MRTILLSILTVFMSASAFANCANFVGEWSGQCEKKSNGATESYEWNFSVKGQSGCSSIEVLGIEMKIGDVTTQLTKTPDISSTIHSAVKFWGPSEQSLNIDFGYSHTNFKNGQLDTTDFGRSHIFLDKTSTGLNLTIFENNSASGIAEVRCSMTK